MSHSKDWCFNKAASCSQASVYRVRKGGHVTPHVHASHARESSGTLAKPVEYQVFKNTHSLCFRALQRRVFQHKLPHSFMTRYRTLLYMDTGCFHEWVPSGWECGNPFPPAASALLGHVPAYGVGCSAMERENDHHFLGLLWAHLYVPAHTSSQAAVGSLSHIAQVLL